MFLNTNVPFHDTYYMYNYLRTLLYYIQFQLKPLNSETISLSDVVLMFFSGMVVMTNKEVTFVLEHQKLYI